MIMNYLSNLLYPRHITPCSAAKPAILLPGANAGIFRRALRQLCGQLAEIWRRQEQQEAIRRDTEHLHTLTDAQLRDIGITRMDIPRAVRFGKENL